MKNLISTFKVFAGILFFAVACLSSYAQTPGLRAMNDTIDLYPGIVVTYDILANDTIPAADTIRSITVSGGNHVMCQRSHDLNWKWTFTFKVSHWGFGGEVIGGYKFYTMSLDTSSAKILFRIHDKSYGYLDINNVSARFSASGSHFFYDSAQFEVPKGSGKTSIFSNSFWIGGKDAQNQLHFAGERYRQGPTTSQANTQPDFYAGPVMDSVNYSIYQDTVWNYIWNLKQSDVTYHRLHYTDPGYTPIHDILFWPGNGDVSKGIASKLAPFFDVNANGIYDPFMGDYPLIRGDQALFFIFNDDRGPHLESLGAKLKVEVHGMAYAFDMPEDSALKNTVFLNYKLYNRSQNTYDSTLLGVFTDIDLGYPNDDYIGSDVGRSLCFGYNGMPIDGHGEPNAYGEHPPVQSVTILGGPLMDPDGTDNPRYDLTGHQLCDFSVNGLYFGDSIVDNERYGMQRFIYCNNSVSGVPAYMQDPLYAIDYYTLLSGKWKDGTEIVYGGNGSILAGGYGPEARFMFPGLSDSTDWGIGCQPPFGPKEWTETSAANNPGDRRGVQVTGPFTFKPGDVQDLDLSFGWARDYNSTDQNGSLDKMRQMADIVHKAFATNRLPNGNPFFGAGVPSTESGVPVKLYPNPASDFINIAFGRDNLPSELTIELMTIQGNTLQTMIQRGRVEAVHLDVAKIPAGFYLVRITSTEGQIVKPLVIMH
ncbi:MAG: T9SS type A sorting domain-containing protein [Bacteroidales bacterium]